MSESESELRADFVAPGTIRKATDTELSRYALRNVLATKADDVGEVYLVACDGRQMTVACVEGQNDIQRLVPGKVFPTAVKQTRQARLNGRWESHNLRKNEIAVVPDDIQGRYPRVDEVIPAVDDVVCVSFDAKIFAKMVPALTNDDSSVVTLCVRLPRNKCGDLVENGDTDAPIAVVGQDNAFGILMPMAARQNENQNYEMPSQSPAIHRWYDRTSKFGRAFDANLLDFDETGTPKTEGGE